MEQHNLSNILKSLRAPLPHNAVLSQHNNPDYKYIDVDWYRWRANREAGEIYKKEVMKVDITDKYVLVVMRIHFGSVYRDGIGIHLIDSNGITNALNRAEAEAMRRAFDEFEMGWANLDTYQKHGIPATDGDLICPKCRKPITGKDLEFCRKNPKFKNTFYHEDCTPKHLLP